jgi:hypothetical protein
MSVAMRRERRRKWMKMKTRVMRRVREMPSA